MLRQKRLDTSGPQTRKTFRSHALPPDEIDNVAEFKKWLELFFIGKGKYKVTEKGKKIEKRVSKMIAKGKAEELYDKGHVVAKTWAWTKDDAVRIEVVKKRVETPGKNPRDIVDDDFRNYGLNALQKHYEKFPYGALVETGYAFSYEETVKHSNAFIIAFKKGDREMPTFSENRFYPWEMARAPSKIWNEKEMVIAAARWLAWKIKNEEGTEPKDINARDFGTYGLGTLLKLDTVESYIGLLFEAGLIDRTEYLKRRHL